MADRPESDAISELRMAIPGRGDPEETTAWEGVSPRELDPKLQERFEGVVAEIFMTLGMDLDTPATKDTPRRFLNALFDATSGYEEDPKLMTAFPTECRGGPDCRISQVIEGPLSFSRCANTMLSRSMASLTSVTSLTNRSSGSPR